MLARLKSFAVFPASGEVLMGIDVGRANVETYTVARCEEDLSILVYRPRRAHDHEAARQMIHA